MFEIKISSWEDIVDLLEERRNTYQWYVNNCQYTDSSNVEVLIYQGNPIRPVYNKITKKYKLHETIQSNFLFNNYPNMGQQLIKYAEIKSPYNMRNILNPPREIDCRWCYFNIKIINIGSTTIEDYNLELLFDGDSIEKISDNHSYVNNYYTPSLAQQINRQRDDEREVYESKEYNNVINYHPKNKILVQEDSCSFRIGVIPKSHETKAIKLYWELKARDYNKKGELKLMVEPSFENEEEVIKVYSENDIKPEETIIQPKIKME